MSNLALRQRQHVRRIDAKPLRQMARFVVADCWGLETFTLGIHLVGTGEITGLNERFLHHAGSTDVITFNYADSSGSAGLEGEIFICVEEALSNAHRYQTTWQAELVRYVIHGLLHLRGYDDQEPVARRRMRRQENRWLTVLGRRFVFASVAAAPGLKLALRHDKNRGRQRRISRLRRRRDGW
jgi:probable rRNA maturation factor